MPKFQTFSNQQQEIIDNVQAELRSRYQSDPQNYDNAEGVAEMERISREASILVIDLMPDALKFKASDIEKAFPRASKAIRQHLSRLSRYEVSTQRVLYCEDGLWYQWETS